MAESPARNRAEVIHNAEAIAQGGKLTVSATKAGYTIMTFSRFAGCFLLLAVASLAAPCRAAGDAAPNAGIVVDYYRAEKPLTLVPADLAKLPRAKVRAELGKKHMVFEGVPLGDILRLAGARWGGKCSSLLDCYVLVTSEDGFRAVFASPEVDPGLCHQMVILADRCNGEPLRKADGPYQIVEEDAKQHGRWVKRVMRLSVRPAADADEEAAPSHAVAPPAKTPLASRVYLVGMGPGDAELVTFKAAAILQQADCVFCFDYLKNEVARYVPRNKIEVAPPTLMGRYRGQDLKTLSPQLRRRARENEAELATFVPQVRRLVAAKKTVVFADAGDPTIYCPWSWVTDEFADLGPLVIPGLSSFNAGNAAIGQSITKNSGSIIISPGDNLGSPDKHGRLTGTLVLFTHRAKLNELVPRLAARYPADTPMAIVCEASYERQQVIFARLGTIWKNVSERDLPHLYLVYVGDGLVPPAMAKDGGKEQSARSDAAAK
jgi:precorrin-4 methylase